MKAEIESPVNVAVQCGEGTVDETVIMDLLVDLSIVEGIKVTTDRGRKSEQDASFWLKILNPTAISGLVQVAANWLAQTHSRTLKFVINGNSIEATGLTAQEQEELIRWFQLQVSLYLVK